MAKNKLDILWNNITVGTIEDFKADNFDVYGKWTPIDSAESRDFVSRVNAGEDIEVQVGFQEPKMIGAPDFSSEDEINIKLHPHRSKAK